MFAWEAKQTHERTERQAIKKTHVMLPTIIVQSKCCIYLIIIIYKPVVPGFLAFLYHPYLLDDPKKQIRYFKTYCSLVNFNVVLTCEGSYFLVFFKFHDFFNDFFYFSMTIGLAVIFEKFENFTCFSIFLALKEFTRKKLWYPPKCVRFALSNYSSLSYVSLALSSAVTNLPHKGENFNFPWLFRPWKWNS